MEIPPPNGWQALRSTQAIAAALGWQADGYNAVQAFTRKSAAKYLDLRIPFSLQSAVAVKEICRVVRERFPDLPKYKDDWHIKALLHRYLLSTSRRSPRKHGSTNITNNRHKRLGRSPTVSLIVARPPAPCSQHGLGVKEEYHQHMPIYQVTSFGRSLWVQINTGLASSVLAREAAERGGVLCPRREDGGLRSTEFKVDFDGSVEVIDVLIYESLPYGVDLSLGMDWIRSHNGAHDWDNGHYFFESGKDRRLHTFTKTAMVRT